MQTSGHPAPTVLIVAYHSDEHLPGCLDALRSDQESPGNVVVIDNSPSDSTRAIAESRAARYLAAPDNVGFAAAVNLGLDAAWDGASDVLLLNPDARIDAAGVRALSEALHASEAKRAAVGPRLRGPDGRPQRPSWPIPSPGWVWCDALGLGSLWRGREFVVGAVLLLSGAALADIGRLDERYFLYAEEADWQQRAIRAGWSVAVVDTVTASHVGGASSGDPSLRERLFYTSARLFARRWYGSFGWTLMRWGSLVAALRRSVLGPAHARATNRRAVRLFLRGGVSA